MPRTVPVRRPSAVIVAVAVLGVGLVAAVLAAPVADAAPAPVATSPGSGPTTTARPATTPGSASGTAKDYPTTTSRSSCIPATLPPVPVRWAAGEVVRHDDFEAGVPDVWGSTTVGSSWGPTGEVAASGVRSLRISDSGRPVVARVGFDLPHPGWYRATAMVRLAHPATDVARLVPSTPVEAAVPGLTRVSSDGWTQLTTYVRPSLRTTTYCDGSQRTYPDHIWLDLALGDPDCDTVESGSVSLYVDDFVLTTMDSATSGSPSPIPTPTVTRPPVSCPPPGTTSSSTSRATTHAG